VEQFVGQQQTKIQQITDKQITRLNQLIKITPNDDPQKADFYFRLGELYAEKQRFNSLQARSFDEKIFQAEQKKNTSLAAKLKKDQQDAEKNSEKWANEAIKDYVEASKHAKYERMDEVLFRLAYLLQMMKKDDRAREFFHRLIKDYPQSKYVPNAYLSFAEYYFAKARWRTRSSSTKRWNSSPSRRLRIRRVQEGLGGDQPGQLQVGLGIFVNVIELCHAGKIDRAQRGPLERKPRRTWSRPTRVPPALLPTRLGSSSSAWW